jgi:cysteine-rich repeat protein
MKTLLCLTSIGLGLVFTGCADETAPAGTGAAGGAGGSAATSTTTSTGRGGDGGGGGGPVEPFCGDGTVDPDEACDDGNVSPFDGCRPDCTVVDPIDAPPLEWTYVEVPGTRCMNGDTAGFGISINPDSPNVMIYLEGGGACFNDACDFTAFNIPFIPPPDGIFNRNNDGNPVRDWSMVYVPYCTGDIHGGDNEYVLGGQLRQFRGYTNITKYLELWVPTFAGAETVLLTGISAGGFGAGLNIVQVSEAFGPGPQMVLVDDSGPPLSNAVIPPCLQQIFREVWGLDETVLAVCGSDCPDPNDFATGFLAHAAENHPDVRVGVFSNTADLVIRSFMGTGWSGGVYDECEGVPVAVPPNVYEDGLLALRATYEDRAGSFFVGQTHWEYNYGLNHTVLRSPSFFATVIDGVSVQEWVGGVIAGDIQHVGP